MRKQKGYCWKSKDLQKNLEARNLFKEQKPQTKKPVQVEI